MNCVRCKLPLVTKKYEAVEIDQCKKCGGTWLDEGELQQIIDIEEEKFSPELIKSVIAKGFAGVTPDEENSIELCPKCSKRMTAVNYSYNSGIVIDRCPAGHGIWLDGSELEKVQANQEQWTKDIAANKGQWNKTLNAVRDQSDADMRELRRSASDVPSKFFVNRIVAALMRVLDKD